MIKLLVVFLSNILYNRLFLGDYMKIKDFTIGEKFYASAGFEWLCTDKGTRTITAIMLEPDKAEHWFNGPPYHIDEEIFDEHDMLRCYSDTHVENHNEYKISSHPNFLHSDVFKMCKDYKDPYHRKNIIKYDRIDIDGGILHPYGGVRKADGWHVQTFELFSKKYDTMHEDKFILLEISDEKAMSLRKSNFNK